MLVFVIVAASVLAISLTVLLGLMLEFYRQAAQLRLYSGLSSRAEPLDVPKDLEVDRLPLMPLDGLEATETAAILLLSTTCATCSVIGKALPAALPPRLMVLVSAPTAPTAASWLDEVGLATGPQVVFDDGAAIAETAGLYVAPSVLKIENRQAASASTVPDVAQLEIILSWLDIGKPSWMEQGSHWH